MTTTLTEAELTAAAAAEDAHGSYSPTSETCTCGDHIGPGFYGWYHHWLTAIVTAAREAQA